MKCSLADGPEGQLRQAGGQRTPMQPRVGFIVVSAILDMTAFGIAGPVLPTLIVQLTGSNADAGKVNGLILALWALMQFIASPIIGAISDRIGRRPVLLLSASGLAAAYVVMAVAPNLWWLAGGRMLSGVTSASITTAYAYMADVTTLETRVRGYGLVGAAFSAGAVLGPLLGGLFAAVSTRAPFWAAGALGVLTFVYGLLVLPESLTADRKMAFSWRRANPVGALRLLCSHRNLSALGGVTFLMYCAMYVTATLLVLYANYRYGLKPWQVGALLALVGIIDAVVQGFLAEPAASRLGNRGAMVAGLSIGAVALACIGVARDSGMLIIGIALLGMRSLAAPTLRALMTRCVSASTQGQLQGAIMGLTCLSALVSAPLFGAIYARSIGPSAVVPHPGASFFVAALVMLGAAVIGARDWEIGREQQRIQVL
jgi:DHA1 family tetracycline resistance protein-like MFS transporter